MKLYARRRDTSISKAFSTNAFPETLARFLHQQRRSSETNQRGNIALVNRKDGPPTVGNKISGNNFPLVLFHRCIQSGLSISQIKDHPRRLATRNTDKKKLLLDFCAKVTVRNPAIFGPGLGVKSHDTFHAAIPYRTLLFANDLFHKLRDKISVQRCSVPVFWKSWKENESNRGIECIKSKRDFVQTFLSQSTTFASREILIDVRSADWPCTIDIIYRATIIPASSLSTTRFSINKYYSLHRRDKSTKFNISTLFFFSFRADFSAFFLELKLNSNSR